MVSWEIHYAPQGEEVVDDQVEAALALGLDEEEMRLVKAPTMHSAVTSIETYVDDPDADLPKCG